MVHQKDFMVNKLKVQTKNFDQNRQNRISMCTIFENSATSRQKEAPNSGIIKRTLTYFTNLVKKISSLKDPKMKNLMKKPKNEIWPNFAVQMHY